MWLHNIRGNGLNRFAQFCTIPFSDVRAHCMLPMWIINPLLPVVHVASTNKTAGNLSGY
uniref:Uncharacterized protein n=1 Tax=Arundo donax TaxID=35708 RepID=A0A0A9QEJ7_ARUDO